MEKYVPGIQHHYLDVPKTWENTPAHELGIQVEKERKSDTIRLHYLEAPCRRSLVSDHDKKNDSKEDVPTVMLIHGMPDTSFGWRNQVNALTKYFNVLIPDLRGCGASEMPEGHQHYRMRNLAHDAVAILLSYNRRKHASDPINTALAPNTKAVFVGHDWGAILAFRIALYFPEYTAGVASLCVPYYPPARSSKFSDWDYIVSKAMPILEYQRPLVKEADRVIDTMNQHPESLFRQVFKRNGHTLEMFDIKGFIEKFDDNQDSHDITDCMLSNDELKYYVEAYKENGGFHGVVMHYNTTHENWEDERELCWGQVEEDNQNDSRMLKCPVLYIPAEKDVPMIYAKSMTHFVQKHQSRDLPGLTIIDSPILPTGHWPQIEEPELVKEHLLQWLLPRFYESEEAVANSRM